MVKRIVYNDNAREALLKGINVLSKAVGLTLGPKGRNVILECKSSIPKIVNDGVTIAREIELKDPVENIGVTLVKQAALKTNEVVGDGTTTSTILAQVIVEEGIKNLALGANSILIKKGIDQSVKFLVDKISEYAQPVLDIKDLASIASVSAGNNLSMGNIIAAAFEKVGREGVVSLEEGEATETSLQVNQGMSFNTGYMSHYFLANPGETEINQENPLVLLTDIKITNVQKELVPILERVSLMGRPLLIVAQEIEQEALSTLIINKIKGVVDIVAIRIPSFIDKKKAFLEDISILTNAKIISEQLGVSLTNVSLDYMGSAKRIVISKDMTTIISDVKSQVIDLHRSNLRNQINLSIDSYQKQQLADRLSKLNSGVALIKVGAKTSADMLDNRLRFEDAIHATKAAIEEGILPGGGSAFLHLSNDLDAWSKSNLFFDELLGAQIVVKALLAPLYKIVKNAGGDVSVIIGELKNTDFAIGYNANDSEVTDLYLLGVVDPAKVIRLALQNAASIASILLTTECVVSDLLAKVKR